MAKKFNIEEAVEDLDLSSIQAGMAFAARMVENEKVGNLLAGVSTGIVVGKYFWDRYKGLKSRKTYTIRISESDPLFMKVQQWIFDELPYEEQRSVVVRAKTSQSGSTSDYIDSVLRDETESRSKFLDVFYDGERTQDMKVGNHTVSISVDMKQTKNELRGTNSSSQIVNKREVLISARTIEARDAVLAVLTKESKKAFARRPRFWVAQKWGNFRNSSDVPVRPIESVVLREGQKEHIIASLRDFLSKEKAYTNLGIPWHTGLLLYGPPGTGKTSVATTIAHTLNLDIHYISLSSLEDDNALLELLQDVSPRSILLLEDIDVARSTKKRSDEGGGVTLTGLLNGLDGIATPHGIITIMTTNHFEALDPALVRPGRVDLLEEIGYVDTKQAEALCQQFLGFVPDGIPTLTDSDRVVASQIVDIFKQNLDDFEKAGKEVVIYLQGRLLSDVKEDIGNVQTKPVTKSVKAGPKIVKPGKSSYSGMEVPEPPDPSIF